MDVEKEDVDQPEGGENCRVRDGGDVAVSADAEEDRGEGQKGEKEQENEKDLGGGGMGGERGGF